MVASLLKKKKTTEGVAGKKIMYILYVFDKCVPKTQHYSPVELVGSRNFIIKTKLLK